MDNKEIAKEILLKCIDLGIIKLNSENAITVDAICEAYKEILKTVKEG